MTKQEIVSLRICRAVSKDVGLAGVMLYVPLVVKEDATAIAWTDGVRMYFGIGFFQLSDDEQVGVCIHECLHVVFRHMQRGVDLYEKEGSNYLPFLWNIACDAVINYSIRQITWARLPTDAVQMETLLGQDILKPKPAYLWTSEQIYEELKKQPPDALKAYAPVASHLVHDPRGKQRVHTSDRHERQMETRIRRERIVRAQAGSLPGGLLRRLAADVPQAQVRWELVLREFLKIRCMPSTENSWNRPSRRTLSIGERARFIEAGIERKRGLTRLGVVVDTSGSISDEILSTFIGEINGIMAVTAAEAVVVDCDAAVQQVTVFRRPIRSYKPRGGGGTDFSPGLAELEKERVTVAVYLTDLCGTFPEKKPPFPVLWAVTEDREVPFGHKVLIPTK